ncbi:MAG: hypothetical protein JWL69_1986, partial [Phycisphaerales bacterium]|nr:hypothetical protein [Phycisphaerales bacterium]
ALETMNIIGHAPLAVHDTINIGNAGSLSQIVGPVYLSNSTGYDDIHISDAADSAAQAFTLSTVTGIGYPSWLPWGQVAFTNFVFPARIYYTYLDTASISLATGYSSTVNVQATGVPTTVNGGNAGNNYYVYPTDGAGHSTILGALTLSGGFGTDTATFDTTADPTGVAFTLAGGIVTTPGSAAIDTSGLDQQFFYAGAGNDSWTTVLGALSNPPTTVNAGPGDDTVNIEVRLTPATWVLDGGTGNNTLNLTDGTNTSSTSSWVVNSNVITRHRDTIAQDRTFNYNNWTSVNLYGSAGADTFNVESLPTSSFVSIFAGDNFDTINMMPTLKILPSFNSGLAIDGGAGGAALTFNNSNAFTSTATITSNSFSLGSGAVTYSNIYSLTYAAASSNSSSSNTVNILSTSLLTSYVIYGGIGSNTLNLGMGDITGLVSNIMFAASGSSDAVNVNDQNDNNAQTYTIALGSISVAGLFTYTTASGFVEVTAVNAGNGADSIAVTGRPILSPTTVNGGGGNDAITVGTPSAYFSNIASAITVNGNAGTDTLGVFDSSSYGYRITGTSVADFFGSVVSHLVNYATMEGVTLNTSGGGANTQVQSTASGTPVTINPGVSSGSGDGVTLGGAGFPLDGILSPVTVNGLGGTGLGRQQPHRRRRGRHHRRYCSRHAHLRGRGPRRHDLRPWRGPHLRGRRIPHA